MSKQKNPQPLIDYLAKVDTIPANKNGTADRRRVASFMSQLRGMDREANAHRVKMAELIRAEVERAKAPRSGTTVEECRAEWAELTGYSDGTIKSLLAVARKVAKLVVAKNTEVPVTVLDRPWRQVPAALDRAIAGKDPDAPDGSRTPPATTPKPWAEVVDTRVGNLVQSLKEAARRQDDPTKAVQEAILALRKAIRDLETTRDAVDPNSGDNRANELIILGDPASAINDPKQVIGPAS